MITQKKTNERGEAQKNEAPTPSPIQKQEGIEGKGT